MNPVKADRNRRFIFGVHFGTTMGICRVGPVALLLYIAGGAADLLVVENGPTPWPSGHGEDPPPIGSLVRLDSAGTRHLVAGGLVDPVWVVGSSDGLFGTWPPTF